MARVWLATAVGLVGFLLYVGLVLRLADAVAPMHWAVQFVFFALAGVAWVVPARWLILWAARR